MRALGCRNDLAIYSREGLEATLRRQEAMTAGDDDIVEVGQHRPLRAIGRDLSAGTRHEARATRVRGSLRLRLDVLTHTRETADLQTCVDGHEAMDS